MLRARAVGDGFLICCSIKLWRLTRLNIWNLVVRHGLFGVRSFVVHSPIQLNNSPSCPSTAQSLFTMDRNNCVLGVTGKSPTWKISRKTVP